MMAPRRVRQCHIGVSKNRGTPKWMVKIMENPIKIDDLGDTTIFGKHPYTTRDVCYMSRWDETTS